MPKKETDWSGVVASNKTRAKHGMYKTRVYRIWVGMHQRCYNKNSNQYHKYGGRGIKVCKRWHKFENFLEDMGEPPEGMSIDRKNNNRGYTPANCRWTNPRKQANNRRTNVYINYDGKKQTIAEWAREYDIPYHVIKHRVSIGWRPPKLFNKESYQGKTSKYQLEYGGKKVSVKEYSELTDIPLSSVYVMIYRGEL